MTCCNLRQIEKTSDGERQRCVNDKSQVFLAIVDDHYCGGCPVRAACTKGVNNSTLQRAPELPNYPFCDQRVSEGFLAKCSVTGLPVTPEQCNKCSAETKDHMATLPEKLSGYASAIRRWIAAGRPTRSTDETKALFEDHCSKCEMYDREKHSCKSCGCSLAATGNPLFNKLAMKTEHCPLGRF